MSNTYTGKHFKNTRKGKKDPSPSTLHFGHYIAAAKSLIISHFHALKTTISIKSGFALDSSMYGISCMLEEKPRVSLIEKLRAILLLEADFNKGIKEIFGNCILKLVRKHGLMPEDIFSETGKTSDNGALAKVLSYDISCQSIITADLISIDASNCYDSITHDIFSLLFKPLNSQWKQYNQY